jgi:hypothetical protein
MTTRPARAWAEVTGGDALGRGQQPVLCWWLPEGSSVQHAYRLRTDDGYDTGRVEGTIVLVPPGTTATVTLPGEAPRHAPPGRHRWTGSARRLFHDHEQFRANSTAFCT